MTIYDVGIDSPAGDPARPEHLRGWATPVNAASTCEAAAAAKPLPR